jgi:hypothetical protein
MTGYKISLQDSSSGSGGMLLVSLLHGKQHVFIISQPTEKDCITLHTFHRHLMKRTFKQSFVQLRCLIYWLVVRGSFPVGDSGRLPHIARATPGTASCTSQHRVYPNAPRKASLRAAVSSRARKKIQPISTNYSTLRSHVRWQGKRLNQIRICMYYPCLHLQPFISA